MHAVSRFLTRFGSLSPDTARGNIVTILTLCQ